MSLFLKHENVAILDKNYELVRKNPERFERLIYFLNNAYRTCKKIFPTYDKLPTEIQADFFGHSWHLYLAYLFKRNHYKMVKPKEESNPDIILNVESLNILIEAKNSKPGLGGDESRFLEAIKKKIKQRERWISVGTIRGDEPFIIAVNCAEFIHKYDSDFAIRMLTSLKRGVDILGTHKNSDPHVYFPDGKKLRADNFLTDHWKQVSGIIFSNTSIFDSVHNPGEDVSLILNPFAENPAPESTLPFGKTFKIELGQGSFTIKQIK